WTQQNSKLVGSGASGAAKQDTSVALSGDGNTAVVGGPGDSSGNGAAWVFVQPATVSSVSPNAGPVDGGALVEITGSRLTSVAGVSFGGTAAAGVTVVSDTLILANTPAHAAGTVDVSLTGSLGTTTSAGAYTYDIPTGAVVLSSSNPSVFGQPVTFTAYLGGDGGTPTGSVTFKNGATTVGSAALSSGVATITTSALGVGSHAITAVYGGHGDFNASVSPALTQTVGKGASKSTLVAAPNPATPGQLVDLVVNVAAAAPAHGTPDGTVTFKEGATTLGSVSLSGGNAVLNMSALAIGSHKVTASYGGSGDWTASASAMVTELVDARVGKPFQVNSFNGSKTDVKQSPAVATLAGGSFVVVWQSQGEDGSGYGIYGQVFKAAGVKSGGEFKVNATTKSDQIEPAVAALADGGFIVVWSSNGQDTSGFGVYAQRYNKNDVRSGGEFKVNTTIANDQSQPAVAGLADGGFVVAWASNKQDGSTLGIYAQRYTKRSVRSGGEFKVNTTTARNQQTPSVAALSGGGFVVAWTSNAHPSFGYDIYGQLFDKSSAKLGGEFLVNSTQAKDQTQPA
ncbi:MAG: Ig-like domain repeat protein, partial [Pseudolabrys sp.]